MNTWRGAAPRAGLSITSRGRSRWGITNPHPPARRTRAGLSILTAVTPCKCNLHAGPIDPAAPGTSQSRDDRQRGGHGKVTGASRPGHSRNPLRPQPAEGPRGTPSPAHPCALRFASSTIKRGADATRSEGEAAVPQPEPPLLRRAPEPHEQCSAISNQNIGAAAHRKSRGKIIESIALRKDCSFSPILVLTILQQG